MLKSYLWNLDQKTQMSMESGPSQNSELANMSVIVSKQWDGYV